MTPSPDPRRRLPAVDRLVAVLRAEAPELPAWAATAGARSALAEARRAAGAKLPDPEALAASAAAHARAICERRPRRVVNATGVALHTNLGRAALAGGAGDAARAAATGFTDLELDLATGRRGDRIGALGRKLALLADAEAALAVNNNAAALLLAVATLAGGREVVVSRGELVEIGGSFRLPDILAAAGVRLVEVGTTNRTHADDYRRAIGPDTALLLKVHRSNFEQRGFVAEVEIGALGAIARERSLPLLEDLGSGTLVDLRAHGLPQASYAPARLAQGADVVCFSGDKLFGGPQAGILIGAERPIAAMRAHPLARALRLDKMSLAALDWTADAMLAGRAEDALPALRMLLASEADVAARAHALGRRLVALAGGTDLAIDVVPTRAPVGAGSLPGFEIGSTAVSLRRRSGSADALAAALRTARVPVIGRVADGAVLLDARTLLDGDEDAIESALAAALQRA